MKDESGDGPASSAEWLAAGADLAVGEGEDGGHDERGEERSEDQGFEDEDDVPGVPAGIEGEEGAESVVVGEVEEEMAEDGDEGEEPDEEPVWFEGGRRWMVGLRWALPPVAEDTKDGASSVVDGARRIAGCEAVPEVDGSGGGEGDEGCSEKGVGDAAVVLEGGDRAAECPEHVEVGRFGGEGHGEGCVGGAAVEAGAGEDRLR